ncbi:MAG TPA: hypothetical protein VMR81_02450 [Patescibacteria group bacterium]|nr:hypothetical protein [Patescibacteria group bacterium]
MNLVVETVRERAKFVTAQVEDGIFLPEHVTLLWSINQRAHVIAENVRQKGTAITRDPVDPWVQGYTVLPKPDLRIVFIQESQDSLKKGLMLALHISHTLGYRFKTDIQYNLWENRIELFRIDSYKRQPVGSSPIIAYRFRDHPQDGTRIPAGLKLSDIVAPIDRLLQLVETASEHITRTLEPVSVELHHSVHSLSVI